MNKEESIKLLKKYNKENFHIQHAITVSEIMKYYANKENEDEEYWGIVGLLHDIDFEMYPEEHCIKAVDILEENGYSKEFIKSIVSHGYGICTDIKPELYMEKVLFAVDELTGLIYAASLMRPSKSTKDMNLKSLKKKFKDKGFAAGCSRDTIRQGAEFLNIEIDELLSDALLAMQEKEDEINNTLNIILENN